jgi:hypothetical protein
MFQSKDCKASERYSMRLRWRENKSKAVACGKTLQKFQTLIFSKTKTHEKGVYLVS